MHRQQRLGKNHKPSLPFTLQAGMFGSGGLDLLVIAGSALQVAVTFGLRKGSSDRGYGVWCIFLPWMRYAQSMYVKLAPDEDSSFPFLTDSENQGLESICGGTELTYRTARQLVCSVHEIAGVCLGSRYLNIGTHDSDVLVG